MTLAEHLIGKKVKNALIGFMSEGQVVGAVEVTQSTNLVTTFGMLTKQMRGSRGSVLIVAIKV